MAFSNSPQSCFFLLGFCNPAAVLLAMGVAQFLENWKQAFFLHQVFKLSRHFDGSYLFIFEGRLYRLLPFGGEFLTGIVRKKRISPPPSTTLIPLELRP